MKEENQEVADSHHRGFAQPHQFLLIAGAGFASMAGMRLCDTLLPELARSFNAGVSATAATVSLFAIAYGIFQLIYGPIGDRYGKQRVICLAVSVSALINLALVFSPNLSTLVALRFLAGAAAAGIVPLSLAYVGDSVPYSIRQEVLAKYLSATILGMIFGQWIGGLFADTLGWRAAFLLLTVLFGMVALLMARSRPAQPTPESHQRRAGYVSQVLLILRTHWARRILAAGLIEGAAAYGPFVFIPVHLHTRFGLSLTLAGAVVVLYGLGGLIYAFSARHIVARLGEQGMVFYGGLLIACGFGMLAFGQHWAWSMPACALAGFGFYMMHNTLQANATQMVAQARGTAVSLFASCLFLGQSLGVSAIALLIKYWPTNTAFMPSMVILPLLGGWLAMSMRKRTRAHS